MNALADRRINSEVIVGWKLGFSSGILPLGASSWEAGYGSLRMTNFENEELLTISLTDWLSNGVSSKVLYRLSSSIGNLVVS